MIKNRLKLCFKLHFWIKEIRFRIISNQFYKVSATLSFVIDCNPFLVRTGRADLLRLDNKKEKLTQKSLKEDNCVVIVLFRTFWYVRFCFQTFSFFTQRTICISKLLNFFYKFPPVKARFLS